MFSSSVAPPMDLYGTPTRNLHDFVVVHLQPNQEFLTQARQAINLICTFLKENCFKDAASPRPRVLKVVKGGSFGKGTALRGRSDADLVVFLSNFKQYKDQLLNRKEMIQEIERRLREFKNEENNIDVQFEVSKRQNPRVLSFTLSSGFLRDSIEFDVLPAFDALGHYIKGTMPDPQVYIDLIKSHRPGEFSTCFTELQRDFIKDQPTKVKSLIRLLKHWYKKYVYLEKAQLRTGESLPPKYALELLAVYAWEKGSGQTDFDMAEGFQTVLLLLQQYKQICVFWTKFYDFKNETLALYLRNQLKKPRPVILDPADPTGIVGEGSRWDLLAEAAKKCPHQQGCLSHWNVPMAKVEEQSYCTIL
uniref:Uncharacterized protein n=3 Tax=Sphaerodactylus townsendi TaxID=933632 RepID=A0ACB8FZC4_9SAUR